MKNANIVNILAGIGAVSILLISSSVALNPNNNAQTALTLGGLTGAPAPAPVPSGGVVSAPLSPDTSASFCGYMKEWRDSSSPNDVFMAGNGHIYIANSNADGSKGKIQIERSAGGQQFIGDGLVDGVKIIDARGVTVYKDGKNDYLFVADYGDGVGSGQIVQYSYVGDIYTFKKKWTAASLPKELKGAFKPTNIVSYKNGTEFYLAIVNSAQNNIIKFKPTDTNLSTFTLAVKKDSLIQGMAVSASNIFVSTSKAGENKILRFTLAGGDVQKSWGETGSADWQFGSIKDIAVYKVPNFWATYVYVADPGRDRILQFDSDGNYISAFEGSYGGKNFLQNPGGMTVGPDGQLYFTDATDGKVYKFGTDSCVVLKITKDFLPTTDPKDFRFTISSQKAGIPTFTADLTLDDDPSDGALSDSRSFNLFRQSGSAIITEIDDYKGQIAVSRECKYGKGVLVPEAPGNTVSADLYYGGPYNCIFKNSYNYTKIVVIKKVLRDYDSTDFNFTLSTFPDFILEDDSADKNPYNNTEGFIVEAGKTYTLTEKSLPAGFEAKVSYECIYTHNRDGTRVKNADGTDKIIKSKTPVLGGRAVDLILGEGQTATCTFINELPDSRVQIRKDAQPNTPPNKFFFFTFKNWYGNSEIPFKLYDNSKSSRLFGTFSTDNYTITETLDPAYKTFVSCVGTAKQEVMPRTETRILNIGPNDFKKANFITCTFENISGLIGTGGQPTTPPSGEGGEQ